MSQSLHVYLKEIILDILNLFAFANK